MTQDGDILLFQTVDGGEITVNNGLFEMSGGLESMVYLCMFGGNEDDDGSKDNSNTYWGNLVETEDKYKYVSETQYLLKALSASSSNLRKIENAVKNDTKVLLDEKIAQSVEVSVSIPGLNKLQIVVIINTFDGKTSEFKYIENWKVEL